MRFIRTTKQKDMTLAGINVSAEVVDNVIRSLTLRDKDGGLLRVVVRNYNELHVEVPEPIKLVKRWKLGGTVLDLAVDKTFDAELEAVRAKDSYLSEFPAASLEIKEIEIPDPELTQIPEEVDLPF